MLILILIAPPFEPIFGHNIENMDKRNFVTVKHYVSAKTIDLGYNPHHTVGDLKILVRRAWYYETNTFSLFYNGKLLTEDLTLIEEGIPDEALIYMVPFLAPTHSHKSYLTYAEQMQEAALSNKTSSAHLESQDSLPPINFPLKIDPSTNNLHKDTNVNLKEYE